LYLASSFFRDSYVDSSLAVPATELCVCLCVLSTCLARETSADVAVSCGLFETNALEPRSRTINGYHLRPTSAFKTVSPRVGVPTQHFKSTPSLSSQLSTVFVFFYSAPCRLTMPTYRRKKNDRKALLIAGEVANDESCCHRQ